MIIIIIKYNIYIAPYSQVLYGAVHCFYDVKCNLQHFFTNDRMIDNVNLIDEPNLLLYNAVYIMRGTETEEH